MNYLKAIVFGVLVYAIAFLAVSAFIGFGVDSNSIFVKLATSLSVLIAVLLLAKSLRVYSQKEMLACGLIWTIIVLLLDMLVTIRFTGWGFFRQRHIILGYLLILLAPLLAIKSSQSAASEKKDEPKD